MMDEQEEKERYRYLQLKAKMGGQQNQLQKPSLAGRVASSYAGFMGPEGAYGANPSGKLFSMVQAPFQKAGTALTEQLGKRQVNPYVSAAAGTAVQMAPDIALSSIPAAPTQEIPEAAIPLQRRAYGFQKSLLKTPFARGKAALAAKTGLEQGVTSATGNPEAMMNKATAVAGRVGQKLGDIRESAGPQPVNRFLDALDQYKEARLRGARGGIWDTIASKIEEAKNTIRGLVAKGTIEPQPEKVVQTGLVNPHGQEIKKTISAVEGYTPPTSLKRIADAKSELQKTVNWFADNVSQGEAKKLSGVIEKAMEQAIADSGADIKQYRALKPIYGSMKTIGKGLNNEIAAQQGNMAVSLPSQVMAGAGAAATGNPIKALQAMGVTELIKRRGAGAAASAIKDLFQSRPTMTPAIVALLRKLREGSNP